MLKSIEGVYEQGKIELVELASDVSESRVIVTFLEPEITRKQTQTMQFGMFSGNNQSMEEDFKIAEFQGDKEDSLDCIRFGGYCLVDANEWLKRLGYLPPPNLH